MKGVYYCLACGTMYFISESELEARILDGKSGANYVGRYGCRLLIENGMRHCSGKIQKLHHDELR